MFPPQLVWWARRKIKLLQSQLSGNCVRTSHHLVPHQNHLLHLNRNKLMFKSLRSLQLIMITIRNVSWAANQYIRMISDGSCDTEDWSNDAENTALHDRINYIWTSGGPLSALTCCVNARLLSAIKKNIAVNLFSKLGWELGLFYASLWWLSPWYF